MGGSCGNGQGPFWAPLSGLKFWNPRKESLSLSLSEIQADLAELSDVGLP